MGLMWLHRTHARGHPLLLMSLVAARDFRRCIQGGLESSGKFVTLGLCLLAFGSGHAITRVLRAGDAECTAPKLGLGISHNGTGLVLASLARAEHPRVML